MYQKKQAAASLITLFEIPGADSDFLLCPGFSVLIQCPAYAQIIFGGAVRHSICVVALLFFSFQPAISSQPVQRFALADDWPSSRRAQRCCKRR